MQKGNELSAYYNEFDTKAAAWLRELIKQGLIADGTVDERSITEVTPADLAGYTQCHFFAGIGVWSYALRQASWADDRPAWTGSCPCQPFSAAGQGKGADDDRHLWPAWFELIQQCQPKAVFGEQVGSALAIGKVNRKAGAEPASPDGYSWIDNVQIDLENARYAVGASVTTACGFGAPHIRQRLYFVAERMGDAIGAGLERYSGDGDRGDESRRIDTHSDGSTAATSTANDLANPESERAENGGAVERLENPCGERRDGQSVQLLSGRSQQAGAEAAGGSEVERLGNANESGRQPQSTGVRVDENGMGSTGREQVGSGETSGDLSDGQPTAGPTNGFWRVADWLGCRDDKWRPVESGSFPLAHGLAARLVRLRGYGNAINAEQAKAFIASYIEVNQ